MGEHATEYETSVTVEADGPEVSLSIEPDDPHDDNYAMIRFSPTVARALAADLIAFADSVEREASHG